MFDISRKLLDRLSETEDGCRVFTGALDTGQYGIVWIHGRNKGAHIVSYEHHIGPVPEGMCVLHICDNPPCCNPEHLFLGTQADNITDMIAKGRAYVRKGEEVNTARLTEKDVIEIYSLIDSGYSQRDIGLFFDISHNAVGLINRGKNWKDLYKVHRT